MARLRVTGNRVLIKEHKTSKKKTESGIIVPDNITMKESTGLQKNITTGTVLSAGAEARFAKNGEDVLFSISDAVEIEFENESYLIIRDNQITLKYLGEEIVGLNTDRVLVQANPMDKITASGIIIPENVNYEPSSGTVLLSGPECKELKTNMKVIFGKGAGMPFEFCGKEYVCIREADVVAVL